MTNEKHARFEQVRRILLASEPSMSPGLHRYFTSNFAEPTPTADDPASAERLEQHRSTVREILERADGDVWGPLQALLLELL